MKKLAQKIMYYFFIYPFYKLRFGNFGKKSWLVNTKVDGFKNINIGNNVYLNAGGWIAAAKLFSYNPKLQIGNGVYIGRNCHIYATREIVIKDKVLMADNVYITDNLHEFANPNIAIIDQPIKQVNNVLIGYGAWIGEKVSIIGASVGRNSVIGANSVVTKDIPDYCVAVGIPAKVIKQFDFNLNKWITL